MTKKFFRFPCPFPSTCRIYLFYFILFFFVFFNLFYILVCQRVHRAHTHTASQRTQTISSGFCSVPLWKNNCIGRSVHGRFLFDGKIGIPIGSLLCAPILLFDSSLKRKKKEEEQNRNWNWNCSGTKTFLSSAAKSNRNWNRWKIF